jgi:hypothetical protein
MMGLGWLVNMLFFFFFFFFLNFGSNGVCTQSLVLASQVLYHLSHTCVPKAI